VPENALLFCQQDRRNRFSWIGSDCATINEDGYSLTPKGQGSCELGGGDAHELFY
jgi:hypothetical protein